MWLLRVIEVALGLPGAFLLIVSIRNAIKGFGTRNWRTTSGSILRSFVLVDKSDEGETSRAEVEYEYKVDGAAYKGTRLRFGQTGIWTRAQAERLLAPYPAGSSIDVFFDPRRPAEAVLIRGVSWGNLGILAAGLVFVGFAWGIQAHI